ncbi:MAG: PIN domain-containing protein [Chryseobacterium sp.]|uniref:PIN domain-containing protein n=1 Tax=Chryseobacterium sp. TaxID=1871047 RepID=UPI0025C4290B|nr:PIN domain-containing protein [Chryseobacterium sp.]MCJ7933324.1 PIN domain-containing protein [Chryseobacterium sp.]
MKCKLLIDTCVWLDLAKSVKNEKLLSLLEEFLHNEEIELIVPQIVIDEFSRNKERIIFDASKSMSSHFKTVKNLVEEHSDKDFKETILTQLNNIDKKIPLMGESVSSSISRIEKLLSESEILEITDAIKLNATQRAIEKQAPFHNSKNSIGDAIIIETLNDYKIKNIAQEFAIIFITHNTNDFSVKTGNKKDFHEDFAIIFDSNKCQYFINLPEALNSINPALVEEFDFTNDWEFEFREWSEILEAEEELRLKIWYNRHKFREHQIELGKIKIIKREDFDIKTSQTTIVDDIWEGALKSAKKVEEKFSDDELYFDDFEWGMINGKLSALRWITGDEWDNLDG